MKESLLTPPHISGREHKSYIEIIEEFRDEMDYLSCKAKNPDVSITFSIAYDAAQDILDYFLAAN
jgi:2-phosphoglycerate kinase